jgi:tRNA threonylcarbamoyl adenosine modification protein YeaZ
MNLLAIETSSPTSSLALFLDSRLAGEVRFDSALRDHRILFGRLDSLLSAAGCAAGDLQATAAGVGPGRYAGIRAAVTMAQTLVLPSDGPCDSVSSAAVLAWQTLEAQGAREVAVLGDARRGEIWAGLFGLDEGMPALRGDWILTSPETVEEKLPAGILAVSPEWDRLARLPSLADTKRLNWIRESRFPSAAALGNIVLRRRAAGLRPVPPQPMYLHAPVRGAPTREICHETG